MKFYEKGIYLSYSIDIKVDLLAFISIVSQLHCIKILKDDAALLFSVKFEFLLAIKISSKVLKLVTVAIS